MKPKTPNSVRHEDGVSILALAYKGQALECVVDTVDYPLVSDYWWSALKSLNTFYAYRRPPRSSGSRALIYMHKVILPGHDLVDHKDHNGLNNRRENIRPATVLDNSRNQSARKTAASRFKGVAWEPTAKSWLVRIRANGKRLYLGHFKDDEEAARAYDVAAKQHHGEFAVLNFPEKAA